MDMRPTILSLHNELLRDILDQIVPDPEKVVCIDRRQHLSVESFSLPKPPKESQAQDIANFRLACRRFSELGIPHQFARVTLRFSRAGFERLDQICSEAHLSCHTKKFSYMIPSFYVEGRDRIQDLLQIPGASRLNASKLTRKAQEQKEIIHSGLDVRVLKKAMSAFTSLQHVQILRLQDQEDHDLLQFLESQEDRAAHLVELKWTPACIHATKTVALSLVQTKSPFDRFSAPMMNPQSALEIRRPPALVASLAEHLTCLELHFDAGFDVDERMHELSFLCGTVFHAAKNMQAVHVGFPSRLPLSLPLEEIFHNVHWERLRAFGIQSWRLNATEIMDFARRHRRTLKGLRLRDVLLKEGSLWRDVLIMLHQEMDNLDWLSLRRIDYAHHFDDIYKGTIELPDDPLWGSSESDDEDSIMPYAVNGDHDTSDGGFEYGDDSSEDLQHDDDHGPQANELALVPDTSASALWSAFSRDCSRIKGVEDFQDDGYEVKYQQRKLWEAWVINRPFEERLDDY